MRLLCDPFGFFCFLFLYCLLGYLDYVIVVHILDDLYNDYEYLYYGLLAGLQFLILMLAWTHFMCLLSNPGIIELDNPEVKKRYDKSPSNICVAPYDYTYFPMGHNKVHQKYSNESTSSNTSGSASRRPELPVHNLAGTSNRLRVPFEFEWTFCSSCRMYRPPRAHHCQICDRCILKMDHHCPWINNCVGEQNMKYFLLFAFYSCLCALYSGVCIIFTFIYSKTFSPVKVIHIVLLTLAAFIFGIFAIAVLSDQIQGIFNDQTSIERLRGQKGPKKTRFEAMQETFGYSTMFCWVLPLPPRPLPASRRSSNNNANTTSGNAPGNGTTTLEIEFDVEETPPRREEFYSL